MRDEILRMERVTSIENGVTLLDNLNLNVFRGEVLGLLCVNDHGQEELVRLMCQNAPIHYGRVYFHEQLVNNHLHSSMSRNRVAVIEKQSRLIGHLTVADNVFVLQEGFKKRLVPERGFTGQLKAFTGEIGVDIEASRYADELTPFERCAVELIKAYVTGMRLVVLRDISNFISSVDLERVHDIMRFYAGRGMAFLYVCNHHEEVFRVCGRAALMENGRIFRVLGKSDMTEEAMRTYIDIVSAGASHKRGAPNPARGASALSFRGVSSGFVKNLDFDAYGGECVVLLDINNTSLSDVLGLAAGLITPDEGEITLMGKPAGARKLRFGVAVLQEKPTQTMLFPHLSYIDNLCFMADKKINGLWRSPRFKKSVQREYAPVAGEDIFAPDLFALPPSSLYTLVYSRIDLQHPLAAVLVQPFSGADFYLRLQVIELISRLLKRGVAVVILAVSLSDSLKLADRLIIIRDGETAAEYGREELCAAKISDAAIGSFLRRD